MRSTELGSAELAILRHNLLLHHEQRFVIERIESAGVAVIPLKGTVNQLKLYGDLGRRAVADIDLFVRRQEFGPASDALTKYGYSAEVDTGRYDVLFSRRHAGQPLVVELHRSLGFLAPTASPLDDEVWERASRRTVDGDEYLVLDPVDHLLLLALNVAKHRFSEVHRADEFGIALQRLDDQHLTLLTRRARRLGLVDTVAMSAAWTREHDGSLRLSLPDGLVLPTWKRWWFERVEWPDRLGFLRRLPVGWQMQLLLRLIVLDRSATDRRWRLRHGFARLSLHASSLRRRGE